MKKSPTRKRVYVPLGDLYAYCVICCVIAIWCDLLRVIISCDLLCDVCLPYLYAACYFLNCIVTFVCMLRVLHGVVWRSWNVSVTSVEGNAWKCLSWLVSWMYWCFLSKEMKEKIKYQFFYKKDHIQTKQHHTSSAEKDALLTVSWLNYFDLVTYCLFLTFLFPKWFIERISTCLWLRRTNYIRIRVKYPFSRF